MKEKILILTMLFLFIFPIQAYAMDGYVSLDYNSIKGNSVAEVKLWHDIDKFRIGLSMVADVATINLEDGYFPAGIPNAQYYGLFATYDVTDNIQLTFNEWCNHYFAQSPYSWKRDRSDITFGVKLEFGELFK